MHYYSASSEDDDCAEGESSVRQLFNWAACVYSQEAFDDPSCTMGFPIKFDQKNDEIQRENINCHAIFLTLPLVTSAFD